MSASVHCPAQQIFHFITLKVSFKILQTKLPLKVVKRFHHFDMELCKTLLRKMSASVHCRAPQIFHITTLQDNLFQNLTGKATLESREDFIILIWNLVKLCER